MCMIMEYDQNFKQAFGTCLFEREAETGVLRGRKVRQAWEGTYNLTLANCKQ